MSNNNGLRRHSSCGASNQQQYQPFMLGNSKGYSSFRTPQMASVNTVSAQGQGNTYMPPARTSSMYDASASVRDCMYWPGSLNNRRIAPQVPRGNTYASSQMANSSAGDFQYCSAPPKVYISGPDGKGMRQQNIPCQIAPLGTDPSSLIKPMQPLTVRVQAPPDLFSGNPSEPKTISISPAQLYGSGGGR